MSPGLNGKAGRDSTMTMQTRRGQEERRQPWMHPELLWKSSKSQWEAPAARIAQAKIVTWTLGTAWGAESVCPTWLQTVESTPGHEASRARPKGVKFHEHSKSQLTEWDKNLLGNHLCILFCNGGNLSWNLTQSKPLKESSIVCHLLWVDSRIQLARLALPKSHICAPMMEGGPEVPRMTSTWRVGKRFLHLLTPDSSSLQILHVTNAQDTQMWSICSAHGAGRDLRERRGWGT